jgi:hypothetical protein
MATPVPVPSATDPTVPLDDDTPTPHLLELAPPVLSMAELREVAVRLRRVQDGDDLLAVYGTTDPGPWLADRRVAYAEFVRLYGG